MCICSTYRSAAEKKHLGINNEQMVIAGMSINKITPKQSMQNAKRRGLRLLERSDLEFI